MLTDLKRSSMQKQVALIQKKENVIYFLRRLTCEMRPNYQTQLSVALTAQMK